LNASQIAVNDDRSEVNERSIDVPNCRQAIADSETVGRAGRITG